MPTRATASPVPHLPAYHAATRAGCAGLCGLVHEAHALGEVGRGNAAEHVVDDAVLRVQEERLRDARALNAVGVGHVGLGIEADRVGDALRLDELERVGG